MELQSLPYIARRTIQAQHITCFSRPTVSTTICLLPRGQTPHFCEKQTRSAIKGCCMWLGSLDPQQQLPGGQPRQQATVTLQFKMASKMATII